MAVAARNSVFPSTRAHPARPTGATVSSGGILWRRTGNGIEICLSTAGDSFGRHYWTIPRGRVLEDERLEDAAVRQVYDKTGAIGRMQTSLERVTLEGGEIGYFYLLRAGKPTHRPGIATSEWVELQTAIRLMRTEGERNTLLRAAELIAERTPSMRPV